MINSIGVHMQEMRTVTNSRVQIDFKFDKYDFLIIYFLHPENSVKFRLDSRKRICSVGLVFS